MALTLDEIRKKKAVGFRVSRENASKAVRLRPWETMNRASSSDAESDEGAKRDQTGSNGITEPDKRDQAPAQTGSSSLSNGITPSSKWDQAHDQMGSREPSNGITRAIKWDHGLEIHDETLQSERPQVVDAAFRATETASASVDPISETSRSHLKATLIPFQGVVDPISETSRSHLKATLIPFQGAVDPISRPTQTGSRNGIKWDQPTSLPTADQAQRVMLWLAKEQLASGLGHTQRIQRGDIAKGVGISLHMVKVQLTRLCGARLIERVNARRGRGPSGTVFRVADSVLVQLKRDQEMGSNGSTKRDQEMGSEARSSSDLINVDPTTTQKSQGTGEERSRLDRFQVTTERLGLGAYAIDANDLMRLWRSGAFENEKDLLESVEHFTFYLTTESASSIRNPKSVLIATLKAGYYAPPADFVSWEEQQKEAKLKAAEERLARLRAIDEKEFTVDFEIWLRELTDARWKEFLRGTPFAEKRVVSDPVKNILKPVFTEERRRGADKAR